MVDFRQVFDLFDSQRQAEAARDAALAAAFQANAAAQSAYDAVDAYIGSNPNIIAAVEAAAAQLGAVTTANPMMNVPGPATRPHAWVDPYGRTSLYDDLDGIVSAPNGVHTPFAGMPTDKYLRGTFDPVTRRWAEDVLDFAGNVPDSILNRWASRMAVGGIKRAGVALTCPQITTPIVGARQVRQPFRIAPVARRGRLHIRNFNNRTNYAYTGAVNFTGIWWGEAERDPITGKMTGNFKAGTKRQIVGAFSTPANAAEFVTPLFDLNNKPRGTYLISYGYTPQNEAQQNHLAIGSSWRSDVPAEASMDVPTTAMTKNKNAPFDIWMEVEVPATTKVIAGLGDSLTVGSNAEHPVLDSWLSLVALRSGALPRFYANHGSSMTDWTNTADWKWRMYDSLESAPDSLIMPLGSNDWSGGATLDALKTRFFTTLSNGRAQISEAVYAATFMPRNVGGLNTQIRLDYNDWLQQLPGEIIETFDFADSIASATNSAAVDSRWISSDNVHLNSAGYARNAQTIGAIV